MGSVYSRSVAEAAVYGYTFLLATPVGTIDAPVLEAVAGVVPGQRAQRHQPRHKTEIGVRFAGRDKLVHLIGHGEAAPRPRGASRFTMLVNRSS